MDASDPVYNLVHDERWRLIAVYRADDDNPKELFVPHQAGLDGAGDSSYINGVVLRQRDANSGWTSAADGTLEERRYYCQNWRGDLSAILTSGGLIAEWAKYTSYGIPFGLPGADTDSDGDCDSADITQIQTWIDAPAYDVRGDVDLDGDVDSTDKTLAINNYQGATSGWSALSASAVANRVGYAGYQHDYNLDLDHVRNRVYSAELGRWTRRDPLGYIDGMNEYRYVDCDPLIRDDPAGLASRICTGVRGCVYQSPPGGLPWPPLHDDDVKPVEPPKIVPDDTDPDCTKKSCKFLDPSSLNCGLRSVKAEGVGCCPFFGIGCPGKPNSPWSPMMLVTQFLSSQCNTVQGTPCNAPCKRCRQSRHAQDAETKPCACTYNEKTEVVSKGCRFSWTTTAPIVQARFNTGVCDPPDPPPSETDEQGGNRREQ